MSNRLHASLQPKPTAFEEHIALKTFEDELKRLTVLEAKESRDGEGTARQKLPALLMRRMTKALHKATERHIRLKNELLRYVANNRAPALSAQQGAGLTEDNLRLTTRGVSGNLSRSPSSQSLSNRLGNTQRTAATVSQSGDMVPIAEEGAVLQRTSSQASSSQTAVAISNHSFGKQQQFGGSSSHRLAQQGQQSPTSSPRRIENAFSARKGPLPAKDESHATPLAIGCLGSTSSLAVMPAEHSPARRVVAGGSGASVVGAELPLRTTAWEAAAELERIFSTIDTLAPVKECVSALGTKLFEEEASIMDSRGKGSSREPLAVTERVERSLTTALSDGKLLDPVDDDASDTVSGMSGALGMVGYLQRQVKEKQAQIDFLVSKLDRRSEIMSHIRHTLLKELFILKARKLGPHEVPAFTFFNIIDIVENAQELEIATEALKNEFDAASKAHQQFLETVQSDYHAKRLTLIKQHDAEMESLQASLKQQAEGFAVEMERMKARHAEALSAATAERDAFAAQCDNLRQSLRHLKSKGGESAGSGSLSFGSGASFRKNNRNNKGDGDEQAAMASSTSSARLATASVVHSRGHSYVGASRRNSDESEGEGDPAFPGERRGSKRLAGKKIVAGSGRRSTLTSSSSNVVSEGSRRMSHSTTADLKTNHMSGGGGGRGGRRSTMAPSQVSRQSIGSVSAEDAAALAAVSNQAPLQSYGGEVAAGDITLPPTLNALDRTHPMLSDTAIRNTRTSGSGSGGAAAAKGGASSGGGGGGRKEGTAPPLKVIDPLHSGVFSDGGDSEVDPSSPSALSHQGSLQNLLGRGGAGSMRLAAEEAEDAYMGTREGNVRRVFAAFMCLATDVQSLLADSIFNQWGATNSGGQARILSVEAVGSDDSPLSPAPQSPIALVTVVFPSFMNAIEHTAMVMRLERCVMGVGVHAPCDYALVMKNTMSGGAGEGASSLFAGLENGSGDGKVTMASKHIDIGLRVALQSAADNTNKYGAPSIAVLGRPIDLGVLRILQASFKGETVSATASCCARSAGQHSATLPMFLGSVDSRTLTEGQAVALEEAFIAVPFEPFDDFEFAQHGQWGARYLPLTTPARMQRMLLPEAPQGEEENFGADLKQTAFVLRISDAAASSDGGGDVEGFVAIAKRLLELAASTPKLSILNTTGGSLCLFSLDADTVANFCLSVPETVGLAEGAAVHASTAVTTVGDVLKGILFDKYGCVLTPAFSLHDFLFTPFTTYSMESSRRGALPFVCHISSPPPSARFDGDAVVQRMRLERDSLADAIAAASITMDIAVRRNASGTVSIGPFDALELTLLWPSSSHGSALKGPAAAAAGIDCKGSFADTQLPMFAACGPSYTFATMGVEAPFAKTALYAAAATTGPMAPREAICYEHSLQRYVGCNASSLGVGVYFYDAVPAQAEYDAESSQAEQHYCFTHLVTSTDPTHLLQLLQGLMVNVTVTALQVVADVRAPILVDARNFSMCPVGTDFEGTALPTMPSDASGALTVLPTRMLDCFVVTDAVVKLLSTLPPLPSMHLAVVHHCADRSDGDRPPYTGATRGEIKSVFVDSPPSPSASAPSSVEAAADDMCLVTVPMHPLALEERGPHTALPRAVMMGTMPRSTIPRRLCVARDVFFVGVVSSIPSVHGWSALHVQLARVSASFSSTISPLTVVHHGPVRRGNTLLVLMCRPLNSSSSSVSAKVFVPLLDAIKLILASRVAVVDMTYLCTPYRESALTRTEGMTPRFGHCIDEVSVVTLLTLQAHSHGGVDANILTSRAQQGLTDTLGAFVGVCGSRETRLFSRASKLRRAFSLVATSALPDGITVDNLLRSIALLDGLDPPAVPHPLEVVPQRTSALRSRSGLNPSSLCLHGAVVGDGWGGVAISSASLAAAEDGREGGYFFSAMGECPETQSVEIRFIAPSAASFNAADKGEENIAEQLLLSGCRSVKAYQDACEGALPPLIHFTTGASDVGFELSESLLLRRRDGGGEDAVPSDTHINSFTTLAPLHVPSGAATVCVVLTVHLPQSKLSPSQRKRLAATVALLAASMAPAYRGVLVRNTAFDAVVSHSVLLNDAKSTSARDDETPSTPLQFIVAFESSLDACLFARDVLNSVNCALYRPEWVGVAAKSIVNDAAIASVLAPTFDNKGRTIGRGVPTTAFITPLPVYFDYVSQSFVLSPSVESEGEEGLLNAIGEVCMPWCVVTSHSLVRTVEEALTQRFDVRQLAVGKGTPAPRALAGTHFMLLQRKGTPSDCTPMNVRFGSQGTAEHGSRGGKALPSTSRKMVITPPAAREVQFQQTAEYSALVTFLSPAKSTLAAVRGALLQMPPSVWRRAKGDGLAVFEVRDPIAATLEGSASGGACELGDTVSREEAKQSQRAFQLTFAILATANSPSNHQGAIDQFIRFIAFGLAGCGASLTIVTPVVPLSTIVRTVCDGVGGGSSRPTVTLPIIDVLGFEMAMHTAACWHYERLHPYLAAAPTVVEVSYVPPMATLGDSMGSPCVFNFPSQCSAAALVVPRGPSGSHRSAFLRANVFNTPLFEWLRRMWSKVGSWGRAAHQRLRPHSTVLLPRAVLPPQIDSAPFDHLLIYVPRFTSYHRHLQSLADVFNITPAQVVASHLENDPELGTSLPSSPSSPPLANSADDAKPFDAYMLTPFATEKGSAALRTWAEAVRAVLDSNEAWIVAHFVSNNMSACEGRQDDSAALAANRCGVITGGAGTMPTFQVSHKVIASVAAISRAVAASSSKERPIYVLTPHAPSSSTFLSTIFSTADLVDVSVADARPKPHRDFGGDDRLLRCLRKEGPRNSDSLPTLTLLARGPLPPATPIAACFISLTVQCADVRQQGTVWSAALAVLSSAEGATIVSAERCTEDVVRWVAAVGKGQHTREGFAEELCGEVSEAAKAYSPSAMAFCSVLPSSYWLTYAEAPALCVPTISPFEVPANALLAASSTRGRDKERQQAAVQRIVATHAAMCPSDASASNTAVLGTVSDSEALWSTLRDNPTASRFIRVRKPAPRSAQGDRRKARKLATSSLKTQNGSPSPFSPATEAGEDRFADPSALEIGIFSDTTVGGDTALAKAVRDAHAIAACFVAAYAVPPASSAANKDDASNDDSADDVNDADAVGGVFVGIIPTDDDDTEGLVDVTIRGGNDGPAAVVDKRFNTMTSTATRATQTYRAGRASSWTQCGGVLSNSSGIGLDNDGDEEHFTAFNEHGTQWDESDSALACALNPLGRGGGGVVGTGRGSASSRRADDGGGLADALRADRSAADKEQFSLVPDTSLLGEEAEREQRLLTARPSTATRVTVHVVTRESQSRAGVRDAIGGTWHMSPVIPRLPQHDYAKGYVRVAHSGGATRPPKVPSSSAANASSPSKPLQVLDP